MIFLDTNIFIYTFDRSDQAKRQIAHKLLRTHIERGTGVISTQVIQEFLNVALTKFAAPLSSEDARRYTRTVMAPMCRSYPSIDLYDSAISLRSETGFSFYDSLIVAAALNEGCSLLLTEDLQDGRNVRGVKISNPFKK